MVQTQEVIEGWRGVCVALGLGSPGSRAVCAALTAGAISYALKMPKTAFREDGSARDTTNFLLTPLSVGAVTYLFT